MSYQHTHINWDIKSQFKIKGVACYINTNFSHVMYQVPKLRVTPLARKVYKWLDMNWVLLQNFVFIVGMKIIAKVCGT